MIFLNCTFQLNHTVFIGIVNESQAGVRGHKYWVYLTLITPKIEKTP